MKNTRRFRLLQYALVALALTIIGTLTFLHPIFMVDIPQNMDLTITTTAHKQVKSAGTEIRITGITVNGNKLDLATVALNPNWKMDGEMLACYGATVPAVAHLSLKDVATLKIDYVKQRGSGIMEIQAGNKKENIDCYANQDWQLASWEYKTISKYEPLSRVDLLIGFWFIFFIAIWGGVYWVKNKE